MNNICIICVTLCFFALPGCHAQNVRESSVKSDKIVGGGCDGCEIMYVGMPKEINAVDTSAGWKEAGQKLVITGTVYHLDGKTPASGVIIYYWQTDDNGYYSPNQNLEKGAVRHGHIRGWVKTDAAGKYAIYTVRPAPYPGRTVPAHIHTSIKEPDLSTEYYIDEFVFDDDPLLTPAERKKPERRGGSGVLRLREQSDIHVAEHDIVLGLNIPNYPSAPEKKTSGLSIGEDSPSFTPFHAWGPDRGSIACPVCKYGKNYGILYFVGNKPNWSEIQKWLIQLEKESVRFSEVLKVYFVYGSEQQYSKAKRLQQLEAIGEKLGIRYLALTFVPSFRDQKSEVNLNKINSEISNTFIVYKNRAIIDRYTDLTPTETNFRKLFGKIR